MIGLGLDVGLCFVTKSPCDKNSGNLLNCFSQGYIFLHLHYLFAELPRLGDSEMTIRSSSCCNLSTTPVKLQTIPLMLSAKREAVNDMYIYYD